MRLRRRATIGEIMNLSDIGQGQWETLGIQGEGLSKVVKGAKICGRGPFKVSTI